MNLSKLASTLLITGVGAALIISGCSNNQVGTPAPIYATESVPVVYYASKFAVYSSAGGGPATLTEIDTGSDYYMIESSYVGPNIVMTNESITWVFDHGTNPRSGYLGYTSVSLLDNNAKPLLSTSALLPVVVVPDGVIGNQGNHAIMGMRIDNLVSVHSYLPYPYNQMFIMDIAESQLIFGNLTSQQLAQFSMLQTPESACYTAPGGITPKGLSCWNDFAVPVSYTFSATNSSSPSYTVVYGSVFDSGASTSLQLFTPPPYLTYNHNTGDVTSKVLGTMVTNTVNLPVVFTNPIQFLESTVNSNMVNVGNNIFNYYQILFNQQTGQLGFKSAN